uniref:Serine aminopeptidase S33 n=1 Tax=Megaviridae environmental sample TaxID=1737588 RepID=A0A5J6VHV8_9VIRU|nr:MAG: serine aminopeptidase S33 [Megaviridae environmental sample]
MSFVRRTNSSNLVIWIPGYNDTFYHEHIYKYDIFKNYDIFLIHVNDYTPFKDDEKNQCKYHQITANHQYTCKNFVKHFPAIDDHLEGFCKIHKYKKCILYGHSTGGLIASVYAKIGKYRECFSGIILNDPFLDFNLAWHEELICKNIALFPLAFKLDNGKFKFNKKIALGKESISTLRQTMINSGYSICKVVLTCPPTRTGFLLASTRAHKIIQKTKKPLTDIPMLLLVAKHESTFLNSSETAKFGTKVSSQTRMVFCDNSQHDVFFPIINNTIDKNQLKNIASEIANFEIKLKEKQTTISKTNYGKKFRHFIKYRI